MGEMLLIHRLSGFPSTPDVSFINNFSWYAHTINQRTTRKGTQTVLLFFSGRRGSDYFKYWLNFHYNVFNVQLFYYFLLFLMSTIRKHINIKQANLKVYAFSNNQLLNVITFIYLSFLVCGFLVNNCNICKYCFYSSPVVFIIYKLLSFIN